MPDNGDDILHGVIRVALQAGADAAEAVQSESRALSVGVRNGELEDLERQESRDLGLRVFVGQRQAVVSGSNLAPDAVQRLVERAVATARLAPEDPYAGLAPEDRLFAASRPIWTCSIRRSLRPSTWRRSPEPPRTPHAQYRRSARATAPAPPGPPPNGGC
jgi:predicted Zn-dependent protease